MKHDLQITMNDIEQGAEAFLLTRHLTRNEKSRREEFFGVYDVLCSQEITMELLALLVTGERVEAQDRALEYLEKIVAGEPLHSRAYDAKINAVVDVIKEREKQMLDKKFEGK